MEHASSLLPGCTPFPAALARHYRAAGYWRGETLWDLLVRGAGQHGERTALVSDGERTSYRALHERAESIAGGLLALGIAPGDRVVVQLPNCAALFETLFALFRIGALPVMALPAHRELEIVGFCRQAAAVAYVIADRHAGYDYRALARRVRARVGSLAHVLVAGEPEECTALSSLHGDASPCPLPRAHQVALFQLSGGSTGTPKLIPRTHDDYLYSVRVGAEVCRLDADSVYLVALPAVHNFPLSSPGALGTLLVGGTVVLARSPVPDEVFPLIARERVTLTALVPPLLLIWLEARAHRQADLSSLQVIQVGGAKLPAQLARRVRPTLGCQLQQVFGMAEGLVCYTRLDDPEELVLSTQGRPGSEADEVLVLDDDDRPVAAGATGHLLTRGPYTVRGYYAAEEHNRRAFTPDGFYRTGDLVSRLPSGHLVVEGREKDQINRGGEKIAAAEVESLLLTHPHVLDVALVAMPDAMLGERSCAFVAARGQRPSQAELNRLLRERGLAAFKIPDRYEFLERLPETSVGKVDKKHLRQLIAEKRATEPSH
jgi:2,3-dihydroxybenzoate-AMP ligase